MASKLQEYRRMSEEAQRQLTGSLERWQSFLKTASRLYKYPYHEQVMIHAQRPDATACTEYDVWNNTMGRFVRRGSKGIALIDTRGDRDRLRYVFDVSDTGERAHAIILQAVKDYRMALKCLKNNPKDKVSLSDKNEIERFFRSQWFTALTKVDGEMLIASLNTEVNA